MPGSSYETLRYEVNSGIAEIILDRPPLNLIDRDSTLEYHAALKIADADSDVRVIIISGAGKGLSGGVDLKYLEKFESADMRDFLHLFYVETLQIIRGLNKPIIAAVHGYAREGACTLAFACDMIIAADDADFGYPGVPNLAGPPGMHVWFLQRLIGRMRAAELIFTGEPITAKEAERLGLITRMVPAAKLKQEVRALAAKIGSMSPLALKRTRDLLYQMEDMDFVDVPEAALSALADAFDSEDGREARRAFIEKRKAIWSGK
ncbi:MAG TPA: enoyl-CoA hydratase/isomerase family protein [Gammaproteobacteria bacterium]|jgi:enoyl-CoA hydratase/carnithine racemase|nr:enoyl-CoA hydratase/isomerase family protein [Gammaproteobacteria bacterium]HIL61916.1 enoyl-CoA hydratase/isomerase family protein [Porticoccaceae bacterium]|tara:strand:- start:1507 stop:2295 length:789 start_codon:yes stop_codon:yes gene_type:complete